MENFVTSEVQDYRNCFTDTKKWINTRIADSLKIKGKFELMHRKFENQEVKNMQEQMLIQQ